MNGFVTFLFIIIFESRATEEDAMMKHYILTHPQHFPEPKKVTS